MNLIKPLSVSLFLSVTLLLLSCKTSRQGRDDSRLAVYTIPVEYHDYDSWLKEEMLVLSKTSKTKQQRMLDVLVIDTASGTKLFSQQFREGQLSWTNDHTFLVTYLPGNPEPGQSYSMIYDVKTRQKSEHNHMLQTK